MALPLIKVLQSIAEKAREIGEINKTLQTRIDMLEAENSALRQELEDRKKDLDACRRDVEFLTMSHRLASSPDSLISTRRHIARLIRTIDTCISMLKEE